MESLSVNKFTKYDPTVMQTLYDIQHFGMNNTIPHTKGKNSRPDGFEQFPASVVINR
jgi:hypothetical protein